MRLILTAPEQAHASKRPAASAASCRCADRAGEVKKRSARAKRSARRVLFLALGLCSLFAATPGFAQETAFRFGRSLELSNEPLDISSETLEVDQASGVTIFSGGVVALQGALRLEAERVQIEFEPQGASANAERSTSGLRPRRLTLEGGVILVTPTETLEAKRAVYDLLSGTLVLEGDVLFVQGENLLGGDRLVADLRAGRGVIAGRVRSVIRLD